MTYWSSLLIEREKSKRSFRLAIQILRNIYGKILETRPEKWNRYQNNPEEKDRATSSYYPKKTFWMKTTTKLTLNVGHHGWAKKKTFHSISSNLKISWKTLDLYFVPRYFYNIKNCAEEPFKNSFENTLNQIMSDYF